jgi:hypothetical protein
MTQSAFIIYVFSSKYLPGHDWGSRQRCSFHDAESWLFNCVRTVFAGFIAVLVAQLGTQRSAAGVMDTIIATAAADAALADFACRT